MKRRIVLCLSATIALVVLVSVPAELAQNTASIENFWARFKLAVINGDKESTAQLSQFPLEMPYGAPAVKNRIQFIKRYREVFNGEANAAKCFREAQPVIDPSKRKRFTIGV